MTASLGPWVAAPWFGFCLSPPRTSSSSPPSLPFSLWYFQYILLLSPVLALRYPTPVPFFVIELFFFGWCTLLISTVSFRSTGFLNSHVNPDRHFFRPPRHLPNPSDYFFHAHPAITCPESLNLFSLISSEIIFIFRYNSFLYLSSLILSPLFGPSFFLRTFLSGFSPSVLSRVAPVLSSRLHPSPLSCSVLSSHALIYSSLYLECRIIVILLLCFCLYFLLFFLCFHMHTFLKYTYRRTVCFMCNS